MSASERGAAAEFGGGEWVAWMILYHMREVALHRWRGVWKHRRSARLQWSGRGRAAGEGPQSTVWQRLSDTAKLSGLRGRRTVRDASDMPQAMAKTPRDRLVWTYRTCPRMQPLTELLFIHGSRKVNVK